MTENRVVAQPGELTRTLVRASRATLASVERVLASEECSLDQWLTLDALATAGALPMAALADRATVTGPTLTRVVDRLVSRALVYREVDIHDRRRVRVHLSRRGEDAYRRIAGQLGVVEQESLDRAGGTEALAALARLAE
jgi:DNA-binding MarR family transcriptional regulator